VRLWVKEQSYEKRGTKTNTRGSQHLVSKHVKDYKSKIMYFSLTRQAQLHLNHIGNVHSLEYSDMQDSNMLHIDSCLVLNFSVLTDYSTTNCSYCCLVLQLAKEQLELAFHEAELGDCLKKPRQQDQFYLDE
jgi:hypothetical protein